MDGVATSRPGAVREAPRAAVVGGGISGIAAAHELAERGYEVELFDAGAGLGGRLAPDELGGREICLGGKNVGRRYTECRALLARHGLDDYEFFGPDSARIVKGRVRPLSFRSPSMRASLAGRLVARGEFAGGVRFLRMIRRVQRDEAERFLGDTWFAATARRKGDPTLREYLGRGLSEIVRHMTVRMNGAEPDEAYVGNFGSNLGLVIDKFDQLTGPGFGPLIRRARADHVVHSRATVDGLVVRAGRVTGVRVGGEPRDGFDAVVLAVPAPAAAGIVEPDDPELARLLRELRYFPVGVVVAEYDRPVFPDAFAALAAPSGMALSNAGSYGLQDRHIIRFTFSGRAARDRIEAGRFDPDELLDEAEAFLRQHVPGGGFERVRHVARLFDPGLCAYARNPAEHRRAIEARLERLDAMSLAGDYLRGASLEACVRAAREAVERVVTDEAVRAGAAARAPAPARQSA